MKKLLVIVDMQNDFITGPLGSEAAKAIVNGVCDKIKRWNGCVIVTKDTHETNYLDTLEGQMLPIEHCIKNTDGWKICNEVKDALRAAEENGINISFIDKSSFGSLKLAEIATNMVLMDANDKKWDEIEVCGLCTDICVVSNALILRAAFPNVKITVNSSLCAGTTAENHIHALETLKSCQIEVV